MHNNLLVKYQQDCLFACFHHHHYHYLDHHHQYHFGSFKTITNNLCYTCMIRNTRSKEHFQSTKLTQLKSICSRSFVRLQFASSFSSNDFFPRGTLYLSIYPRRCNACSHTSNTTTFLLTKNLTQYIKLYRNRPFIRRLLIKFFLQLSLNR